MRNHAKKTIIYSYYKLNAPNHDHDPIKNFHQFVSISFVLSVTIGVKYCVLHVCTVYACSGFTLLFESLSLYQS